MTDPAVIFRKLVVLREHLARARRRRSGSIERYRQDVDLQDALALSLIVAIQESIDIAFHLAAEEGLGVPASSAESFQLLARHGVIDADLARRMAGAAAIRNRMAHGCASVDLDRLWEQTPEGLDALDELAARVAAFVSGDSAR